MAEYERLAPNCSLSIPNFLLDLGFCLYTSHAMT
jgi:hypothetical protein